MIALLYKYRVYLLFLISYGGNFYAARAQSPVIAQYAPVYNNSKVKVNVAINIATGYIMVGTSRGLYRFDGEHFNQVPFANSDFTDTVSSIYQDPGNVIWVGFISGKIGKVKGNRVEYLDPEEGMPQKKITAITSDEKGRIWYAAYGEGLYYIYNNRHYLVNADNGLTDANISALSRAGKSILAASDQGIQICNIVNGKAVVKMVGTRQGLPDYLVTAIAPAGDNKFWIGMQDKGFCLYDHSTGAIRQPPAAVTWSKGQVNDLLYIDGALWIATGNSGICRYTVATGIIDQPVAVGYEVTSLLKDIQGNLWLVSPQEGMVVTGAPGLELLPLYKPTYFETIHAILATKNGDTWLNGDGVVYRISKNKAGFAQRQYAIPGLRFTSDITALYEGPRGYIWIGTMGQGVYILNPATGAIYHADGNPTFRDASVLSLSGKDTSIFLCSLQGAASLQVPHDLADVYFNPVTTVHTGTNFIFSIFKDSKNRVWYGTDGMGLLMEEKGTFNFYNDETVIGDKHVYSITEDKKGGIWFSTATAGVYCIGPGEKMVHYGMNEGLSSLQISAIKTLASGHIAVVNKNGLDVIDPATGWITHRGVQTGLPALNAENPGAVALDPAGNLLLTTTAGIARFHLPGESIGHPLTVIESVQLFLNEIDTALVHHFSHNENNLTINYKGIYFTNPGQLYYRYKLEGLDSSWVTTTDEFKIFPRLSPGKYTFRVQSSTSPAFVITSEASYSFRIKQAFYKTTWFILLCATLVIGSIFWYARKRERELKKIALLQQEKMNYRFEVLRNQVNPHFLFNSFNTLISSIEEDPAMAVAYTEQLSDFFRNILNYRDKEIIPLPEEISLLQNYFFLQQKRYGTCLVFINNLTNAAAEHYAVPPLTLQLLAENAIKHNTVSESRPLYFSLGLDSEGNLAVSNNKNRRTSMPAGTGMGLQNIAGRFKILTGKEIFIQDEEHTFTVKLPLIKISHA